MDCLVTDCIHSMTGGYVITCVCLFGGGVPQPGASPRQERYPSQVPVPDWGGYPSQIRVPNWGYPGQVLVPDGGYPSHNGLTPSGQDWMGVPPPTPEQVCLDRLCRGRYLSCGFPQEDFLVDTDFGL